MIEMMKGGARMHKWYSIFPKNPWLSIYTWIALCFLPYMFYFRAKSGLVYMWLSFEMVINIIMTLLFCFVYFALFTAFFIGNIRSTTGFFIMYGLHILTTIGAVVAGFFIEIDLYLS